MTHKNCWEGDWKARIHQRIKQKGYETIISFAERNQKATFFELAKMLGEQVAPIQVQGLLSEAYYEQGQYLKYLRSSLAREIRFAIPEGWSIAGNFNLQRADAFIDWQTNIPDEYKDFTKRVWDIFKNSTDIPKGWLPNGADDPIILDAFQKADFRELELALT